MLDKWIDREKKKEKERQMDKQLVRKRKYNGNNKVLIKNTNQILRYREIDGEQRQIGKREMKERTRIIFKVIERKKYR